jgi:hypothetical protein
MNMLFCAASPGLYSFFTTKAHPASFFPFPVEVDAIPDFSACTTDNERETLKATNTCNRKTRVDIITMNAALSDIILANLPKTICKRYEPICMKQPNMVFLHMFDWFITKYGKTMAEYREDNWQRMTADWHPSNGFKPLATHLFIGASYASAARYPMDDCNVIDIGLHIIKRCGMYSKEYKNWIARENKTPAIVETIDSFKEYWANAIALVNQTAVPASQHGYGMAAMDNNALLALYSESLANFGAAYAATQKINQDPSNEPGLYARPTNKHPAVLHECWPTTPTQHLRPYSTTAHIQQLFWQMQRRWFQTRQWQWQFPTTIILVWRQWSWRTATQLSS